MAMEIFYSQHGEDFLVNKIFGDKRDGVYVEIGCLDGIEYSNTFYFEKKGWRGVCIEAHNDFIAPLRKNRPSASIIHCAVGEKDIESVTFYANKLGSLSTLDKSEEQRWKESYKEHFYGFEEQKVPMRTLTSIFDELKLGGIDFVSLDIEGYEVQALEGLDFGKYKPTVFIVEYKDDGHKEKLEQVLFPNGYKFISTVGCNLLYSLNASHKQIVRTKYGMVQLLLVDQNGVESTHMVEFSGNSLMDKVKFKLKKSFVGKAWTYYQRVRVLIKSKGLPTYEEKREILDSYRKKYNLSVLVETGTFMGDTIEYFKSRFQKLYSIELSKELAEKAAARFKGTDNVCIIEGDSGEVLRSLTKEIDASALYWLDGHYSSEVLIGDTTFKTARADKDTPIVKELETLLNDKHQHTILVDDARLFTGRGDYPAIKTIVEMVNKSSFSFKVIVNRDIIHILPAK